VQETLAVDVDGLLPLLHVCVGHHREIHDTCNRDEDVDRAELSFGRRHESVDCFTFGHVGLADDDLALADGKSALDLLQGIDATSAQGNVTALSCESGGNSGTNTG
jgi:hypothetical protein